jgi:hypothetical protein
MSAPVIIITYWGWDMCSLVEMYECLRGASGTAPDYTVIYSIIILWVFFFFNFFYLSMHH